MNLRRAVTVLLVVAQVATGLYLVVYLFRWQWNRALISGVLFVATEILLVGRLILQRMQSIEDRLDAQAAAASAAAVRTRLEETRPTPPDRFRWLRDSTTRTNVFLPVLLGAGVLASAATWVVESVARRTARPTMERSLATSLGSIAFPTTGFLEPAQRAVAPARRPAWQRLVLVGACVAIIVGTGAVVDVVADATQTRTDHLEEGVTTLVDLRLSGRRALGDVERHASVLMRICTAENFSREIPTSTVVALGADTVRVVLVGDLGDHGTTRLRGCLEDVTLDRIQAGVTSITEVEVEVEAEAGAGVGDEA